MYRIKKFIQAFNDISAGRRAMDEEYKYQGICFSIAIVHIIYLIAFLFTECYMLFFLNILSVWIYLHMGFVFPKKKKFVAVYVIAYIEIMLFASVASMLLGWNWGFMLYTIALVPTSFYQAYTMTRQSEHLKMPFVVSLFTVAEFMVVYYVSTHNEPYYKDMADSLHARSAYAFNAFISFVMVLTFCFLFVCDIRLTQHEMEQKNLLLEQVSGHDPLTKLMNRRSMDMHLESAMEIAKLKGTLFSVIICDIDDFKKVNDTYGHNVGDKVLVAVADTFREVSPTGSQICRWGGEEILFQINAPAKETMSIAENLRQAIKQIRVTADDGTELSISMTFGVAEYIPGYNMTKLISIADDRLYRGKKSGKNCVIGPES